MVPATAAEESRAAPTGEAAASPSVDAAPPSERPQRPAPAPIAPRPQPVSRPVRPQPEPRVPSATPLASAIAAATHSQATLDELARAVFASDEEARKPVQAAVTGSTASESPTVAQPPSPSAQTTVVEALAIPTETVAIATPTEAAPAQGDASQTAIVEPAPMRAEVMAAATPVASTEDSASTAGNAAGVGHDEPKDAAAAPVVAAPEVEEPILREPRDP